MWCRTVTCEWNLNSLCLIQWIGSQPVCASVCVYGYILQDLIMKDMINIEKWEKLLSLRKKPTASSQEWNVAELYRSKNYTRFSRSLLLLQNWFQRVQFHWSTLRLHHGPVSFLADTTYHKPGRVTCWNYQQEDTVVCPVTSTAYTAYQCCFICFSCY